MVVRRCCAEDSAGLCAGVRADGRPAPSQHCLPHRGLHAGGTQGQQQVFKKYCYVCNTVAIASWPKLNLKRAGKIVVLDKAVATSQIISKNAPYSDI